MSHDTTFSIEIPSDSDGFITLQCPYCNDRFKLTVSFIQQETTIELFCPYCGLRHDISYFLRDEVKQQAQIIAKNLAIDLLNQSFKQLERTSRNSKGFSFKVEKPLKKEEEMLLYEQKELEQFSLKCCDVDVKVNSLCYEIGVYCPCCGVK